MVRKKLKPVILLKLLPLVAEVPVKIYKLLTISSRIPEICSDFEPSNILNSDEIGLCYRALPAKTKAQLLKVLRNLNKNV